MWGAVQGADGVQGLLRVLMLHRGGLSSLICVSCPVAVDKNVSPTYPTHQTTRVTPHQSRLSPLNALRSSHADGKQGPLPGYPASPTSGGPTPTSQFLPQQLLTCPSVAFFILFLESMQMFLPECILEGNVIQVHNPSLASLKPPKGLKSETLF